MRVTFIRHGEAEHNIAYLTRGDACFYDPELKYSKLTDKGRRQASDVKLDMLPEIVVTSGLPRALSTTDIIFGNSTKVVVSDIVRETNFHHIVNTRYSVDEILLKYPHYDISRIETDEDTVIGTVDPIDGRCTMLDELIMNLHYCGYLDIAIVSHHTFLKHYLKGKTNTDIDLDNCETFKLVIKC